MYTYLNEQKSHLERIKKLPLVRCENGNHVCASSRLVFFPPNTGEAFEEIKPFLNNLPILQSTLLIGEEGNEIKPFLKNVGVKPLQRIDMILEWICPQYLKSAKPSVEENRLHVRYLFKVWNDVSESERTRLKGQISGIPILRGYKSQNSVVEFRYIKPGDAYLPKVYIGDDDLETYFSVYDDDIWFVDDAYLEDKSGAKAWLQFLKAIEAMDTPQVVKENISAYYRDHQEFDKRNIKREWSNHEQTIEDVYLRGLLEALDEISRRGKVNLSQALWGILVKTVPSEKWSRDTFFQGTHRWFHHSSRSKSFEATFYRQLKEASWLPDEQGNFHRPSKCFAPTDDNRRVLRDSVAYLHPDFNISEDNEAARWLAEKLEIHLNANTDSVINYLQTLSGTEATVKDVEPLYRFLNRQDARRGEEFKKNALIFTPNPESRWWRVDEVFWEDKSEVLENDRRCLKAHYPAILRSFFINLGVSEQASQRDYACRIQEIATTEQAPADKKVRESLRRLYRCLITWQKSEWEIIYDDRCWLGKEGKEWKFFTRQELVLKDHPHIGEIFEGKIPFWTFNDDLSSLASTLKIEGCSQAQVEFHSQGDQEEDTDLSEKVRNLCPYIYAFLKSSRLSEKPEIKKFAEVLEQVLVCRVNQLKVTYNLNGIPVPDPNPRLSFLDVTGQSVILWLGQEANEGEYAELIGDALQDHFDIKELGRFVEDLLTPTKKRDRVLSNWKRKGLETKFLNEDPKDDEKFPDEPNRGNDDSASDEPDMRIPTDNETPKTDDEDNDSLTNKTDESESHLSSNGDDDSKTDGSEIETPIDSETLEIDKSDDDSTLDESESPTNLASDITDINSRDTQSSTKTSSGVTQSVKGESESETPTVHEDPDTENEDDDSTENESGTPTYKPRSGGSGTRPRGGKAINSPNRSRNTGHSSGLSGGREDDTHMNGADTSPHARKEVEHAGMKHARRYEEEQGRTVEDVSAKNLGYDLRSTSSDGEIRCIEVKARDHRALVVLTPNEWSVAKEHKENYFLYVVLNARIQPELYIIQNPAEAISEVKQVVTYQIPLSEITEHGKLV